MACYSPVTGYQRTDGSVVFAERGDIQRSLQLACGKCVGCRQERARQWSVRCVHEASLHDRNAFVTLTYEDDRPSLFYPDFQAFMKRLRSSTDLRVRFFMTGEYGENFGRPHYHALLFGMDFPDRVRWSGGAGNALFRSVSLEKLWPLGYSSCGDVTPRSAAYVSRYCMKKIYGQFARRVYEHVDGDGVIVDRVPEFCRMSLRPGIGARWIEKWKGDVNRDGLLEVNGRLSKVPRYYEQFLDEERVDEIAQSRYEWSLRAPGERTDERLRVREKVAQARQSLNKRRLV